MPVEIAKFDKAISEIKELSSKERTFDSLYKCVRKHLPTLKKARKRGYSFEELAELLGKHDIEISSETLRYYMSLKRGGKKKQSNEADEEQKRVNDKQRLTEKSLMENGSKDKANEQPINLPKFDDDLDKKQALSNVTDSDKSQRSQTGIISPREIIEGKAQQVSCLDLQSSINKDDELPEEYHPMKLTMRK